MTCLFGWIPNHPGGSGADVADAMRRTLAADSACSGSVWAMPAGAVGAMDLVGPAPASISPDGRRWVWAVGELFSGVRGLDSPSDAHGPAARAALVAHLSRSGIEGLGAVNGEFQIAVWDAADRSLQIACDPFGCLPLYWTATPHGFAFAGSVAALLHAPGASRDPDEHAIQEAVTFGGFRLGDRTNVRGIQMLRGGRILTLRGGEVARRRYWSWPLPPERTTRTDSDLIEEAYGLWQSAIRRRLWRAGRPGTTLSGGLDSRAVVAEASAQNAPLRALTYGQQPCDDERLARRVARQAGIEWEFAALYQHDWLERRSRFIQATDGLVQLVDLLHFETFDRQTSMMDVNLCGYVGDVVCGDTYGDVVDAPSLLDRLPYSGVALGWPMRKAREWAEEELAALAPGAARFAIFEHKFPQAIHRIFQAGQRRIRVRRPFVDLDLFRFYSQLDAATRTRVYHGMLRRRYPALFARIPHQKTNAAVLSPPGRVRLQRVVRFAGRRVRDLVARSGIVGPAPARSYHDEERYWREPRVRAQIVGTILRPGSVSAEIFGRPALGAFLDDWFTRFSGPAQSVGALYVFEHYHQALTSAPDLSLTAAAV